MKRLLCWLAITGGFACSVWFGIVGDVTGAGYVAKFMVWAMYLPTGLLALHSNTHKAAAKEAPQPVKSAMAWAVAWFALVTFVWHGHFATAAAYGLYMLAWAVSAQAVRKIRAEAREAAA